MNNLQQKTTKLIDSASKVRLKLNGKKCKVMKANSRSGNKLKVRESEVDEVKDFTNLGDNVIKDGGGIADVKNRLALTNIDESAI